MPRLFHLEGSGDYDYIRVVDDFIDVRYANHNYPEVQDEKITALSEHSTVINLTKPVAAASRLPITSIIHKSL